MSRVTTHPARVAGVATEPDTCTLLGFDFGQRNIGVAVGQRVTGSASPLLTLAARDGQPDWDELAQLLAEWQPGALVVGLPLHIDGSESDNCARARRFSRQLEGRFRLPVHLMDERLSSHEAAARGRGSHGERKKSGSLDSESARIILQDWMDENPPGTGND